MLEPNILENHETKVDMVDLETADSIAGAQSST
jgi:hypothetical protein